MGLGRRSTAPERKFLLKAARFRLCPVLDAGYYHRMSHGRRMIYLGISFVTDLVWRA